MHHEIHKHHPWRHIIAYLKIKPEALYKIFSNLVWKSTHQLTYYNGCNGNQSRLGLLRRVV